MTDLQSHDLADAAAPDFDDEAIRTFATEVLEPTAESGPATETTGPILAELSKQGLLDRILPKRDGKYSIGSALDICRIRTALAYGSPAADSVFTMQGLASFALISAGTAAQQARWLEPVRTGTAVAAFALTEPDVGSDAGALKLSATRSQNGWVLNGTKTWITNAQSADIIMTFARTADIPGSRGVSAFLVPADTEGVTITPIEMISPHPIAQVEFNDAKIPADALVGEPERGFVTAMKTFDVFRPGVGGAALGMAQRAFDETHSRVQQREAFGGTLFDKQAIRHELARCAIDLEAARLLVDEAGRKYDAQAPDRTQAAAKAKFFATEAAQRIIDTAVQFHGAQGLQHGHIIGSLYREVRATRIYEGASEIQLDIIAKRL
jgi:alkylation response protein AidB-like acyl-CoA dehydrogenase